MYSIEQFKINLKKCANFSYDWKKSETTFDSPAFFYFQSPLKHYNLETLENETKYSAVQVLGTLTF